MLVVKAIVVYPHLAAFLYLPRPQLVQPFELFLILHIYASFTFALACSTSLGHLLSCRICVASNSSQLISSVKLTPIHEVLVLSTDTINFSLNMSSADMYPVTELCAVRSAHNAYGRSHSQFLTRPLQARIITFTIELCPHSIFPFAFGLCEGERDP